MITPFCLWLFLQVVAARIESTLAKHYRENLEEKMRPIRHLVGESTKAAGSYEERKWDKMEVILGELDRNPFGISRDNTVGNDSVNDLPRDYQTSSYVRRVKTKLGMSVASTIQDEDEFEDDKEADQPVEDDEEQQTAEEDDEPNEDSANQSLLDIQYTDIPDVLTFDYLSQNITSFHESVKRCLTLHMRANPRQIRPYKQIVDDCVGPNALYLRRYYNDIVFLVKKFLTDSIMNKLALGFCDKDFNICVEFYRAIWLFTELNYDIKETMQANSEPLEELLGLQKLQFLYSLSLEFILQYTQLRRQISKEREMINHLLKIRLEEYNLDFLPPKDNAKEEESDEDSDEDNKPRRKKAQQKDQDDNDSDEPEQTLAVRFKEPDPLLKVEPREDDNDQDANTEPEKDSGSVIDTRKENVMEPQTSLLPSTPEELDRINEEAHALQKQKKSLSKVKVPQQKFRSA
jgi:hypothetical protein